MKLLVWLQNAWAEDLRTAGLMQRSRRVWLYATAKSRSGQRLRVMLGEDCFENADIYFANTTPEVGIGSASKLPPCRHHCRATIARVRPDMLIACGQQAESVAIQFWLSGPLLCVPHPANRLLTNDLLRQAKSMIENRTVGRHALRQTREGVLEVNLDENVLV